MEMTKKISLTVEEKILLHLIQYTNFYDQWEVPFDITQEGIAGSIGIARCNVSRAMKKLTTKGHIEEKIAHVKGAERRRKVYFLTHAGHTPANQIFRYISEYPVIFRTPDGATRNLKLAQLREELENKPRFLELIKHMSTDGLIDQHAIKSEMEHKFVDFLDKIPKLKYFFGRKTELEQLRISLNNQKLIIVRGIAGIGKTTLVTKLILENPEKLPVFWFRFHEWNTLRNILTQFGKFLGNLGRNRLTTYLLSRRKLDLADISEILEMDLKGLKAIMVIDDFHKIAPKIIPFFSAIADIISRGQDFVVIVLTRKHIPFYNPTEAQISKQILELELTGLDIEGSRQLLSARKIKFDDFDTIYNFTSGHPLSLELINPSETTISQIPGQTDIMRYIHTEIFSKLNPEERNLLNIASVYRYPVPTELFFIDENINYSTLDRLLEHSLLTENDNGYIAHDLINEFFYHRLNPKVKQQYHSKAAEYYVVEFEKLAYIEEKEKILQTEKQNVDHSQPSPGLNPSQEIKESKHLSLIEAQHHYLKAGMFKDALDLVLENGIELISKGYLDEFFSILNQFEKRHVNDNNWCSILIFKGDILTIQGEWDEALFYYDQAAKISGFIGDSGKQADSYRNLAQIYFRRSDWTNSLKNLEAALKISVKQKNDYGIANTYFWLGSVSHRQGKYDQAIEYFNKCMEYAKKINFLPAIAKTYTGLSDVYVDQGQYEKAIDLYKKSVEILNKTGHIYEMSDVYNRIGVAYCKQWDKVEQALEYYNKRMEISTQIGDIMGVGYSLSNAAECYTHKLQLDSALQYCERAMKIFQKTDEKRMISNTLMVYGMIFGHRKEWDKSRDYFNQAIGISQKINAPEMLAQNYFNYAFMLRDKGELQAAKDFLEKAIKIYDDLGNFIKVNRLKEELGKIQK
jgi:tetratricopeptide (TPR) repeat protein/DNA-binding MarR family transcriptional regulator